MASVVRHDRVRRWSLVAAVAAVLIALPAVVAAFPSPAAPVEPARLRQLIMASAGQPHQGYAESTGRLGIPDLPNLEQVGSLLGGTTRIRSWYDSPDRWRFAVLSTLGNERDVYRAPDGEYAWEYGTNQFTQILGEAPVRLPRAGDLLPPDLARRVLTAAPGDPGSALPSRRVAGIAAAGLRIRPADPDTTIGQVDIWADPDTGLPVRVEVTARGAGQPVMVTEFLELSLTRPAPELIRPRAPAGSGFTVLSVPDIAAAFNSEPTFFPGRLAGRELRTPELAGIPGAALYGSDLAAFVVLPLPRGAGGRATDAARRAAGSELALPGGTGVLLSVPPVTAIVARSTVSRRSFLIAGLVTPAVLERAAAELSTARRNRP
ncbi:MAG TPA: hypothetical protein VFV67_24575 [Actinophytocola sp.]|uniref:hypothetical protein n=1 Tax=Actinophytocola sp. TaxID=1872138 RepID=UPI002DBF69C4|nr:hypothetical protein [Actinophytocola sp.]HEU5473833.1 hypothetical protein [Actinophytocola sp.]